MQARKVDWPETDVLPLSHTTNNTVDTVSDYQPILIIPVLSRVMERIIVRS